MVLKKDVGENVDFMLFLDEDLGASVDFTLVLDQDHNGLRGSAFHKGVLPAKRGDGTARAAEIMAD